MKMPKRRRRHELPPLKRYTGGSGIAAATKTMGDAMSSMAWGSPSTSTWERACRNSLEASRRRRGR